jgi:hypothetical protein
MPQIQYDISALSTGLPATVDLSTVGSVVSITLLWVRFDVHIGMVQKRSTSENATVWYGLNVADVSLRREEQCSIIHYLMDADAAPYQSCSLNTLFHIQGHVGAVGVSGVQYVRQPAAPSVPSKHQSFGYDEDPATGGTCRHRSLPLT